MSALKLLVKDMDIATGGVLIALLNKADATRLDLHPQDRIIIKKGRRHTIAMLDIAQSRKAVPKGKIGLFEEALLAIGAKHGDTIEIKLAPKPQSVKYIKKKLDGHTLTKQEIHEIVQDIVDNDLTDIELTTYVVANYTQGLTRKEVVWLTQAMRDTGDTLTFKNGPIVDFHCIGGVAGNRTTIIVTPILLAAGLTVPKTSSRAITSPAGTADTMETICSVELSMRELRHILKTVGGFVTWGGAINLAPADEKIITVEHPLSIDARGQMLASIMAKKASVSATHLLIDIPTGKGSKVKDKKEAHKLKREFLRIGKAMGIKTIVIFTDGTEPVGNGIGPTLEMRDCIWLFQGDPRAPQDLKRRSLRMAGTILEFSGACKRGQGYVRAKEILEDGQALRWFKKMIHAQRGNVPDPKDLRPGEHAYHVRAARKGTLGQISNPLIAKIARLAGAPRDPRAGVYLRKHCRDKVRKGEIIYTIYAQNKLELHYASSFAKQQGLGITIR